MKGKRGAPKGNQNARKHGFYSKVRTRREIGFLPLAASDADVDDDIAILRVTILSIKEKDPGNARLLIRAESLLQRTLRANEVMVDRRRRESRRAAERLGRALDINSKTPHARNSQC